MLNFYYEYSILSYHSNVNYIKKHNVGFFALIRNVNLDIFTVFLYRLIHTSQKP